jgi:hypothetical protein
LDRGKTFIFRDFFSSPRRAGKEIFIVSRAQLEEVENPLAWFNRALPASLLAIIAMKASNNGLESRDLSRHIVIFVSRRCGCDCLSAKSLEL